LSDKVQTIFHPESLKLKDPVQSPEKFFDAGKTHPAVSGNDKKMAYQRRNILVASQIILSTRVADIRKKARDNPSKLTLLAANLILKFIGN
jgi:hypothetical protein